MIYVYIYSILLHIMHIFTNRFLVLSESKADIRNLLSLLAYSAVKRTFAIRFCHLLILRSNKSIRYSSFFIHQYIVVYTKKTYKIPLV